MAPKPRKSPSVDRAEAFILSRIADRTWEPGARLPAIEQLAEDAHVCVMSMWKAVRRLSSKGILQSRPGAGTHVSPRAHSRHGILGTAKGALTARLLRDIVEGRFHRERELPSIKELTALYSTGFRTVRASMDSLISEGYLRGRGRRVMIQRPSRSVGARLLFVCGPDYLPRCESSYYRSTGEQFRHYFEQQCALRKVHVRQIVLDSSSPLPAASARDATGCILWDSGELHNRTEELVDFFGHQGLPLVIFDHSNSISLSQISSLRFRIRAWRLGDVAAGRCVGNTLLRLGHRKVCYVTEKHENWSDLRFEGLVSAFAQAGYPDGVTWYSGDVVPQTGPLSPSAMRAAEDNELLQRLRNQAMGSGLDDATKYRLVPRMDECAYWRMIYQGMGPAMVQALEQEQATAWVAGDDYAALYAVLPFLRMRRVRIPEDLSVVSFNNQFESALAGLTSYQFDMTDTAMRMLTYLLHPSMEQRLRPSNDKASLERITGFVVDRESMGPARHARS